MNDQPNVTQPTPTPPGMSSGMRALRAVIGTVLLGVMAGNLVAAVAPDWLASVRDSMPACCSGSNCPTGACPLGGCCSDMTSIGLPTSVLEQTAAGHVEAEEHAAEASVQSEPAE